MNGLIQALALGAARTLAASAGGWLVAHGVMTQSQTDGFIGSICFLTAIGFSAFDKFKVDGEVKAAKGGAQS